VLGKRPVLICSILAIALLVTACSSSSKTAQSSTSSTAVTATSTSESSASATSDWQVVQTGDRAVTGWLDGVDCPSASNCVAVGNESAANGPTQALVDTLKGGSWSRATAPAAPTGNGDYLFSVSCPSAGNCVAVGYFFTKIADGGTGIMLIDTLSGGKWTVTKTPSVSGVQDSFLYGVSCVTATSCVAVGSTDSGDASTNRPLILTLTNGAWSLTAGPSVGSQSGVLQAVSCSAPAACIATGYQATPVALKTLVLSRTGATWSIMPSPGSGEWNRSSGPWGLTGVSCGSAAACVAVGQIMGTGPIINVMSDRRWTSESTPSVGADNRASGLSAVSCGSSSSCVAVGALAKSYSSNAPSGALGSPTGALIETSTGGRWTIAAPPSGLPANSGLLGVSCAGRTCVAVGQTGQFTSQTSTTKTLIVQSH
jgi:hypothetical protein